jgi:hypothetical protein
LQAGGRDFYGGSGLWAAQFGGEILKLLIDIVKDINSINKYLCLLPPFSAVRAGVGYYPLLTFCLPEHASHYDLDG